jgi:hypothetical protein
VIEPVGSGGSKPAQHEYDERIETEVGKRG